jgi:hypothetical protein
MTPYQGNGPYCYANSLAMMLGAAAPLPATVEVLTGSPFGFVLLGGEVPLFDPYGWDPGLGLDDATALLGWRCDRHEADDESAALSGLRAALATGPALVGPVEMGLLRHQPDMPGQPIGADHFVVALEADDHRVLFHDPQGYPYGTLPTEQFLAAWRADSIGYATVPYTFRAGFRRSRDVTVTDALRAAVPGWIAWLRGGAGGPMPPGSLGGAEGVRALAGIIHKGLSSGQRSHLTLFAIRVGARRLIDAARVLADLGLVGAAEVADRQARLVGSLQSAVVAGHGDQAVQALEQLAPTYAELASALS